MGTPLALTLTGGNRHDVTQLLPLLDAIAPRQGTHRQTSSPATAIVRRPRYDVDTYRRLLWKRGIKPVIA
jgi:hypothetical protein